MEELKIKYEHLKKKVIDMLETQKLYFKTRDVQVLRKSKALEQEVWDLCNPKTTQQQSIFTEEFLGR